MTTSDDDAAPHQPPGGAREQVPDELRAVPDPGTIQGQAAHPAPGARERADEEHDEYDDPDLGGEA